MATKYAHIPVVREGVVFSDPLYDESVWCQYRKDFVDTNRLMKMDATTANGFTNFTLCLGRATMMNQTSVREDEGSGRIELSFPHRYEHKSVELGMDTARIFCGSKENWDSERESAAMHTGTDGFFGDLFVFTCKGEENPAGFVLCGGMETMFFDEKSLFEHLVSSFDAREISRAKYEDLTYPESLAYRVILATEVKHASGMDKTNSSRNQEHNPPDI